MMISDLIKDYKDKYKHYCFDLNKDESIDQILTKEGIPNKPGVYIIYSVKNDVENIIYIGKAGTVKQDGTWKEQGLKGRLKAKQGKAPRREFFKKIIQEKNLDKLKFLCFVTFDNNPKNSELPMFSEAKFIQSYFDEFKKLPSLNKSI